MVRARPTVIVIAASITVLAVTAGFGARADANTRAELTIKAEGSAKASYPALAGNYPATDVADPTPSDCTNPTPYCDTVPLVLAPPANVTENDELLVEIDISWNDPADANDVDTWVYDDRQIKRTSYTQMVQAATSANPEKAKFRAGRLRKFNLVVLNFTGANTGYTVTGRISINRFESPFEALAPPPGGGPTTSPPPRSKEDQPPVDRSAESPPTSASAPSLDEIPLPLGPGADASAGAGDATAALEASPQATLPLAARRSGGNDHVSGLALAIWMVLVPLAVASLAGLLVVRNRRTLA